MIVIALIVWPNVPNAASTEALLGKPVSIHHLRGASRERSVHGHRAWTPTGGWSPLRQLVMHRRL